MNQSYQIYWDRVVLYIVIPPVTLLILSIIWFRSIGMFSISGMIITILIPFVVSRLKWQRYNTWIKRSTIDFKSMASVNATMIAGTLIFLTVSNLGRNIVLSGLFDPSELFTISTRSLINALAALTIIPFSASTVLLLLWGPGVRSCKHENPLKTDEKVPDGIKMGTIYMIAGFVWIIATMGVLLSLAAKPDAPTFSYLPTILANAINRNGTVVNYANPIAFDTEDGKNVTVTCTPPSGSFFKIKDHQVKCTALDKDGNVGVGFFKLTVQNPAPKTEIQNATVDDSIIEYMVSTFSDNITFTFKDQDNEKVAAFECNMYPKNNKTDAFSVCDSPQSYTNITTAGIHTFEVRAIDINGKPDETPDIFMWIIKK